MLLLMERPANHLLGTMVQVLRMRPMTGM